MCLWEECGVLPLFLAQGMQCAVCLELQSSVSQSERARANPCGHRFHTACIAGWLVDKGTCPQCRVPVTHASTTAQWPPTFTAPTALACLRKLGRWGILKWPLAGYLEIRGFCAR